MLYYLQMKTRVRRLWQYEGGRAQLPWFQKMRQDQLRAGETGALDNNHHQDLLLFSGLLTRKVAPCWIRFKKRLAEWEARNIKSVVGGVGKLNTQLVPQKTL